MSIDGEKSEGLWGFVQNAFNKIWDLFGGKFIIIAIAILIAAIAIPIALTSHVENIKNIENKSLFSTGIIIITIVLISISFIFLIIGIIGLWKLSQKLPMESEKSKGENITLPKVSNGRFFAGIDVGRNSMKYCLIDYDEFAKNKDLDKCILDKGVKDAPKQINNAIPIYNKLSEIINELYERKGNLDGIGLGLPGQVDPQRGQLIKAPGLFLTKQLSFINEFKNTLHPSKRNIPIRIDNDVRCATRYEWKKNPEFEDLICIFVGNGLGSGVVVDGKIRYGNTFTTGEAGHTTIFDTGICEYLNSTISSECNFLKNLKDEKCNCKLSGYHWEQLVCSYGMEIITKKCEPVEYEKLKEYCKNLSNNPVLKNDNNYNRYFTKYFSKSGDVTTYAISAAYYVGKNGYVKKIVEKIFLKYLAIGIANYINIINPARIYLGGGMIEGFLGDHLNTENILQNYIKEYSLPTPQGVVSITPNLGKEHIASVGAALIFKDESYPYINLEKR